jgi:putative transposase
VKLGLSERRATRLIGIQRASVRYCAVVRSQDAKLLIQLRQIKEQHPRFGVPRVMALLRTTDSSWETVNRKRVERLWRGAGLQVARRKRKKRPPKAERTTIPCKAERPNHVWTYDFIEDALLDGRKIRILNILDEFTREWIAVKVGISMSAKAVVSVLMPLLQKLGPPMFVRSDNGGEFIATEVKEALKEAGASPAYIDPGSPWQNGFVESFHGKLRDEFLDQETFLTVQEAQVCLEGRRQFYNEVRPHSALSYLSPNAFRQQWTENQQKQQTV